jgi:radical SAM superfamily enzyme YgiQ (UPF0313 family)
MTGNLLLVNPWIYDFAAFDLWAKPLGLLYIAAALKKKGFHVRLVDCLDRLHPDSGAPPSKQRWPSGTGQWLRTPVATPTPLCGAPRRFARYGIPESVFVKEMAQDPPPDLILVTSGMTYWYPGVMRAIELIRTVRPDVPVILGGGYATLCVEHARRWSGADLVLPGPAEHTLCRALVELGGGRFDSGSAPFFDWTQLQPDLDLYRRLDAAPILTSRGCPLSCPYCASRQMYDSYVQRNPEAVVDEIRDRAERLNIRDLAFFDDALLIRAESHLMPILESVVRTGLNMRFHVPNGLHVGLITPDLAKLMAAAGFKTLRLGLETLDPQRYDELGGKASDQAFYCALNALHAAGFDASNIGVYILFGLPGQPLKEVLATAESVRNAGARPYLAEYSPLPGTAFWEKARSCSRFDLENEPLYHNNTFFACRGDDFDWDRISRIKRMSCGN